MKNVHLNHNDENTDQHDTGLKNIRPNHSFQTTLYKLCLLDHPVDIYRMFFMLIE